MKTIKITVGDPGSSFNGRVELDGVDISNQVCGVNLDMRPGEIPQLLLTLLPGVEIDLFECMVHVVSAWKDTNEGALSGADERDNTNGPACNPYQGMTDAEKAKYLGKEK